MYARPRDTAQAAFRPAEAPPFAGPCAFPDTLGPGAHPMPHRPYAQRAEGQATGGRVDTIGVTDTSTRAELKAAIKVLRAKQVRLPAHWVDRRQEIAEEVDVLVARVLAGS